MSRERVWELVMALATALINLISRLLDILRDKRDREDRRRKQ